MPIRVGFLIGKDTDLVEDAKYVGNASFLKDMPDKYRVDPESKEYLKDCEEGTKGFAHADVAIPWFMHKHHEDIEVDMIFPDEISTQRLKSNVCNFVIGYDVINTMFENEERQKSVTKAFKQCGNIMPSWKVQDFIYIKSKYMNACLKAGIPMAPTIFAFKGKRTPAKLLKEIKARGWKSFVMKQSMMAFSLGFCKLSVEECEKDPSILKKYFKEYAECPEYVVQECIDGFTRNWETRVFWFNGEFLYAIANKAAVSTEDGTEVIVTGDDIPEEFLENAKRIGKEALKVLPQLTAPSGESIPMTLIRTDIGCSDSQVFDKDTKWNPNSRTFFLNEIEYGGTTYFIRHLKEDFVPKWADLYANKAREIAALQKEEAIEEPQKKRPRTGVLLFIRRLIREIPRMPNILGVGATQLPENARWVAARGTGCYHFLNSEHVMHDQRHAAAQTVMWKQRRQLQEESQRRSLRLLDHITDEQALTTQEKLLAVRTGTYDINGKIFALGKQATAPPKQAARGHWLTQVNGRTSSYNIINGMSLNPAITRHRDEETRRLDETVKASFPAGDVQPLRDIACYDIPGFVPVRQRQLPGFVERSYTLHSSE
ncbi:unnamed protein product [Cladocopium goreaui]|uniref:Uncharacterized protein n=1 Tax=Cladocopium goreaui TaxID=2562237 RepID=A0A9P1C3F1_9DINO|nr:unnamed protein product [Cladocopium goreaui]